MDYIEYLRNHIYFGLLAFVLFIAGFVFSYVVENFKFNFLKVFPVWFFEKTMKFVNPKRPLFNIFLFIAFFNFIAIFLYMLSGVLIIMPFLIAFLTGMNIGIILLQPISTELEMEVFEGEKIEINPLIPFLGALLVPILELSVFSLSIAMGMTLGISLASNYSIDNVIALIIPRASIYMIIFAPILFISAFLEALTVKAAVKMKKPAG